MSTTSLNVLSLNLNKGSDSKASRDDQTRAVRRLFEKSIEGMDVILFQEAFNLKILEDIKYLNGRWDSNKNWNEKGSDYGLVCNAQSGGYNGILVNRDSVKEFKELPERDRLKIVEQLQYRNSNFLTDHRRASIGSAKLLNGQTVLLVSFHGPYKLKAKDRSENFENFLIFVDAVKKQLSCNLVIIGADTNLRQGDGIEDFVEENPKLLTQCQLMFLRYNVEWPLHRHDKVKIDAIVVSSGGLIRGRSDVKVYDVGHDNVLDHHPLSVQLEVNPPNVEYSARSKSYNLRKSISSPGGLNFW